jgi:CO/xanthine dehydrogenase Mo-binding subunit
MIDSPAVRAAAIEVKSRLLDMAAEQLKVPAADLKLANGEISGPGGNPKIAVGQLSGLQMQRVVVGVGTRAPHPTDKAIRPFVTHFAEVEVNKRTGEVRVVRMLAAQEPGARRADPGHRTGADRAARAGRGHRKNGERQLARL